MTKRNGFELTAGIVALVLAAAAAVLFGLNFTTGYYTYGQMQSTLITGLLAGAIVVEIAALILRAMFPGALWPKFLPFVAIGCLAGAAALLLGDRVEGIGNCIVTDYDSGHGGEEAIYMSLASCILMLASAVYIIVGSFAQDKPVVEGEKPAKGRVAARSAGFAVTALAVLLAVLIPTYNLAWKGAGGGISGGAGETYTISFNETNGNLDGAPKYQFLGANFLGIAKMDSRMYVDVTLTLDGGGNYTLFSDCYVVENGKRAELGDPSGLGQTLTMEATGTYVANDDGTVTTSTPAHAVLTIETDTYSAQLKDAVGLNVNGKTDDGVYDSDTEPTVLDFVPETVWTLGDGAIVTYREAGAAGGGTYTISFNQNNGNLEGAPDYQFLGVNFLGIAKADSRLYVDVTLTLDGGGNYTLFTDCYVVDNGKRVELGDPTGLGQTMTTEAVGTYTDNGDGTYTTSVPTHAVFTMETDTYSAQLKDAVGANVNGKTDDGVYDSDTEPAVLDFVPETIWTLADGGIVTYARADGGEEPPAAEGLTVTSDDGGTTITFNPDGTYVFALPSMGVEDTGTYTYEGGVLTVTNANGVAATAEGDPLKLHYVSSMSDQLVGDFTIAAADLEAVLSSGQGGSGEGVTFTSDDGGTTITFNAEGTYVFALPSMGVEDAGTYTYEGGVLTVTNANGVAVTAEGDPLKLHYVSSMSDQLVGDFTIPAADLEAALGGGQGGEADEGATFTSDDGGTTITFNADGTYVFALPSMGVEDTGTYTYEGGVLTVTNANDVAVTAEGDPLKFHYVSSVSDQLVGDFTIAATDLAGGNETASLLVNSADLSTTMTFNADGTYVFAFPSYGVEDSGTWAFEGGVLTVTNSAGTAVTAEGDSLAIHYVSGVSDQLTGDFTVPTVAVEALLDGGSGVTVVSDDGATTMTFDGKGAYTFAFPSYGVEDSGAYAYEGTTLTLTNSADAAATADGDPLKLHYVSGVSDQLTGDFTIPAAVLQ